MKTGATLLLSAFLAAICGSLVDANGVCYDPNHVGIENKNAGTVAKDIAAMKSKGFTYVRTYISKFGNTDMVKQLAASGLQVSAGVPYDEGDYDEQLRAAVAAANDGNVIYVMIGNENLARYTAVPERMVAEIRRVKGLVPGHVKVGTVQRNTEFNNNMPGLQSLIDACDVIGVNIHPFFTGGQSSADKAIALTKDHWTKALALAGDKLILGETGWPSDGAFAGNTGSPTFASSYFSAYQAWSAALPAHKKFYFQMFDQPYKPDAFEKAYGIVGADSTDKFGASVPATTSAPAPQTSAPTTAPPMTPAPTTAAPPTATPKPTVNTTTLAPSTGSLDKASTKSTGSLTGSKADGSLSDAGSVKKTSTTSSTSSDSDPSSTPITAETGVTGNEGDSAVTASGRTTVDTPVNKDSTKYAGGSATTANTQSAATGGATTVVFAVAAGCVAVVAAFGFIYRTRQKAAELEAMESKPSFAITPHGGCVL